MARGNRTNHPRTPRPNLPKIPVGERFWKFVQKTEGCWLWTGCKDKHGYGQISVPGRHRRTSRHDKAHRVSMRLHLGAEIPEGKHVLHHCDNPSCVNPSHLFLGTHQDNMHDAARKGRMKGPGLKGEGNGHARFTEHDVLEIRASHALGIRVNEIGRKYGTSHTNIGFIVTRKTWKHVE